MKFDLKQQLKSFNGQALRIGGPESEPVTLGSALTMALLQSDAKDGPLKLQDYQLLQAVQAELVEIDAKQLARLEELAGRALSIVGYGAVHAALNAPMSDALPST